MPSGLSFPLAMLRSRRMRRRNVACQRFLMALSVRPGTCFDGKPCEWLEELRRLCEREIGAGAAEGQMTLGTFGIETYHLCDLCKTVAMDLLCEDDELILLLSPWPLQQYNRSHAYFEPDDP